MRALSRVMDFEATESVLRLVAATLRCLTRVMAPSWKGEPSRKAPGVRGEWGETRDEKGWLLG